MANLGVDFSIRFPPANPPQELGKAARTAEKLGFSTIWMVDSPLVAGEVFDPFVDLTICAMNTETINLGPAVSNFSLRHPVATGGAILGLDRVSGGRAMLGLGIGGSALVTLGEMTGHKGAFIAHSTADRRRLMREGIELLQQVFQGNPVEIGARTIHLPSARDIPIVIAASGPLALELAGEIADGVIIQVGIEPAALDAAISSVRHGAERADRDPSEIRLIASVFGEISEDQDRDIDRIRPLASYFYSVTPRNLEAAGFSTKKRFPDWVPTPDITHAFDWDDARAAARTYIPDEVVRQFCLVGPVDHAAKRAAELAELGVNEIFLRSWSTYGLPHELMAAVGNNLIARPSHSP